MEKEQKESVDESALNDAFETRIARGETIEPKDWMPERYRTQLQTYVTLARGLGPNPVRAGLYFPLLGAFRELL